MFQPRLKVKETAVEVVATVAEKGSEVVTTAEAAVSEAAAAVAEKVDEAVAGVVSFSKEKPITLKIGASPVPHAEILEMKRRSG